MEELKARIMAAAFGGFAVGGLWFARPVNLRKPFRVVAQWIPTESSGLDADAAVAFRLDLHGAIQNAYDEGRAVEFNLVGRGRRPLPLVPMVDPIDRATFKLPKGYAIPIKEPRIVASIDGSSFVTVPIAAIPSPTRTVLAPIVPNPPLTLVYRPGGGIWYEPSRPLLEDERWRIEAVRTPFAKVEASAEIGSSDAQSDPRRFSIPYVDEAGALEVRVTRLRVVPKSENLLIQGLRLERRFNGVALVVDRPVRFRTHLGVSVVLPRQNNGPRRPLRSTLPPTAIVNLSVGTDGTVASEGFAMGRRVGFEILSPSPQALGIGELRIGGSARKSLGSDSGVVKTGPFAAIVRLTVYRTLPIGAFRTVVPIRPAAPLNRRDAHSPFGFPST